MKLPSKNNNKSNTHQALSNENERHDEDEQKWAIIDHFLQFSVFSFDEILEACQQCNWQTDMIAQRLSNGQSNANEKGDTSDRHDTEDSWEYPNQRFQQTSTDSKRQQEIKESNPTKTQRMDRRKKSLSNTNISHITEHTKQSIEHSHTTEQNDSSMTRESILQAIHNEDAKETSITEKCSYLQFLFSRMDPQVIKHFVQANPDSNLQELIDFLKEHNALSSSNGQMYSNDWSNDHQPWMDTVDMPHLDDAYSGVNDNEIFGRTSSPSRPFTTTSIPSEVIAKFDISSPKEATEMALNLAMDPDLKSHSMFLAEQGQQVWSSNGRLLEALASCQQNSSSLCLGPASQEEELSSFCNFIDTLRGLVAGQQPRTQEEDSFNACSDDADVVRAQVDRLARHRHELYAQAARSFTTGNLTGTSAASYHAEKAKSLAGQIEQLQQVAAAITFLANNRDTLSFFTRSSSVGGISLLGSPIQHSRTKVSAKRQHTSTGHSRRYLFDLHHLRLAEAKFIVTEILRVLRMTPFSLVTGIGRHSKFNESTLQPAMIQLIKEYNRTYDIEEGIINVHRHYLRNHVKT